MYKEEKELLSYMETTKSIRELNKCANLLILMYLTREGNKAPVESYKPW